MTFLVFDDFTQYTTNGTLGAASSGPPVAAQFMPIFQGLIGFTNVTEFAQFGATGTPEYVSTEMTGWASNAGCPHKDVFKAVRSACPAGTTAYEAGADSLAAGAACFTYKTWYTITDTQLAAMLNRWIGCPDKTKLDDKASKMTALFRQYSSYYITGTGISSTYSAMKEAVSVTLTTNFNKYKSKIDKLHNDLNAAISRVENIKNKVLNTLDFVKGFTSADGNLFQLLNCKILNKEIRLVENIVCLSFARSVAGLSYTVAWLGYGMFIFTWFTCCLIRCKRASIPPKDNKVGQAPPNGSPNKGNPFKNKKKAGGLQGSHRDQKFKQVNPNDSQMAALNQNIGQPMPFNPAGGPEARMHSGMPPGPMGMSPPSRPQARSRNGRSKKRRGPNDNRKSRNGKNKSRSRK